MSTLKKALVLSRSIAANLSLRFAETPVLTVVETLDASGNPVITVSDGTPATTENVLVLRIIEMPSIGTNSVGVAQDSYGPHIAQVALEQASGLTGVALTQEVVKMRVWSELAKAGLRTEVYIRANGAAPTTSDITGTPTFVVSDLLWKNLGDM
jgi:hypothetical protein